MDQGTIMIVTIDMLASNLHKELLTRGKNPLATSQYMFDQSSIFFWYGYIEPIIKVPLSI